VLQSLLRVGFYQCKFSEPQLHCCRYEHRRFVLHWALPVKVMVVDGAGLTSPPTQFRLSGRRFYRSEPTVSKYWRKKMLQT